MSTSSTTPAATAAMLLAYFLLPSLLLLLLLPKLLRLLRPSSSGAATASTRKPPLPPGSMGWPYVGETFQLYSKNPNTFFSMKQKRYGPVFKSHVLGCPCVMVTSPEAARFVLVTGARLFRPTFPASKERLMGRQAVFFQEGERHAGLRRLVARAFMPDAIRSRVADVEAAAVETLRGCEGRREVNVYQQMKMYAFNVALLSIFGKDNPPSSYTDELKRCYYTLERGYNSMPVDLPGTLFHGAMRARRQLGLLLARAVSSRREQQGAEPGGGSGLLGSFMDPREALSDEQITDNVIGVLFAARDTTASVLTWVVKHLAENPSFLQAVTEEQETIMRDKEGKPLTWEDTRKMPMTTRVIQETMRVASIVSFTFREAVEDVEYEGYLIPKGWKVMPLFRNIHHNPDLFHDPEKFDPSRFEVAPKPNSFLPFGTGTHSCPGNELAKLEMLVLLHHLTTKYRWCLLGSDSGIQFNPFILPLNGLPVRFFPRSNIP